MIGYVLAAAAGYILLRQNPSLVAGLTGGSSGLGGILETPGMTYRNIGPNSNPATWYQGMKPGTVTISGKDVSAHPGWNPHDALAQGPLKLVGSGIGVAVSAAGLYAGATHGVSLLALSSTLGAVTMGIGLAIGVFVTIAGMISAHHQQALANEGKVLNSSDPAMYNAFVLILQAVLAGELTSMTEVTQHCEQVVTDWYAQVKTIQRGTWHYTDQDWAKNILPDNVGPGTSNSGTRFRRAGIIAPDPCNAACYIGHYWVERSKFVVEAACQDALNGKHGVMVLLQIPPHETQTGFPEVQVVY